MLCQVKLPYTCVKETHQSTQPKSFLKKSGIAFTNLKFESSILIDPRKPLLKIIFVLPYRSLNFIFMNL